MEESISVPLDEEAQEALQRLGASGLTRAEAVRLALIRAAGRSQAPMLAAESAALEADAEDRAEMRAVAAVMDALRAKG